MKKFLAFLLALTMILSLGTVAFAAKTAPVDPSSHTYKAYKIFDGTQAAGDAALANVTWGDGIDGAAFLAALKASEAFGEANPFAACTDAASVANAMKGWDDKSANAEAFAKLAEDYIVAGKGIAVVNGQTELDAGYYLVVDETASVGKEDAYNVALLQLTKKGIFEIQAKNEVPEVDKKIVEGENRVEANNASIGDVVPYEITTAVPAAAKNYEYYFFIIRDTMSKGLTFQNDIVVTIDGETAVKDTDYSVIVTNNEDGTTSFQIALIDATANAGKDVVVTYSAVLNEDAVVGVEGNPNKVNILYSNNPNEDYDGKPTEDGFPKSEKDTPKGETPDEYTITYTGKVKVLKVDAEGNSLSGAEFTLTGDTMNIVLVSKDVFVKAAEGQTAVYYLLNDGTYTKEAPKADSYREATAADGRNGGYVKDGDNYVEATAAQLADENVQLYILVEGNADAYAETTPSYVKTTEFETKTAAGEKLSVSLVVDENGVVEVKGLAAGNYTLTETKAPAGYEKLINPINFTMVWTAPADSNDIQSIESQCVWTKGEGSDSAVQYNAAAQQFEITVVNTKGGELPETGGIGTTIFYIVGAVLVVAAGVLLITKKRMSAEG
ncbi:MAG: isopeptide-forming domain-containing fimbrial protein [Bacillota bacterium]|nr:isopeptide-forming domain-containing fimbrial protein [Bacillota bacterium]